MTKNQKHHNKHSLAWNAWFEDIGLVFCRDNLFNSVKWAADNQFAVSWSNRIQTEGAVHLVNVSTGFTTYMTVSKRLRFTGLCWHDELARLAC